MIQKHSSKIVMAPYIGLKEWGWFRQYADDDAQWCRFVHEYEDRLTGDNTNSLKEQSWFNLRYSPP